MCNPQDIETMKTAVETSINTSNAKLLEIMNANKNEDNYNNLLRKSRNWFVVVFLITAAIGVLIGILSYNYLIHQTQTIIFVSLCLIIESLLFVWWMKFLGKLLADARESMKAWQTKVTDACGFLIDIETSLYKAVVDQQKKALEKNETQTNQNNDTKSIDENTLRGIVKEEIEDMIKESIAERATIEWKINLKDKN